MTCCDYPSSDDETLTDPDVWTIASLAVSTVAMFGTLAQVAIAARQSAPKPTLLAEPDPQMAFDHLKESLERACKNAEKLMRFLAKAEHQSQDPLTASFRYGEVALMLDTRSFLEFTRIATGLAHDVESVQHAVFHLLKHCPKAAARLGETLLQDVTDLKDRVNGFYVGHSNEDVLSDCIALLRTFIALLTRIQGN